MNCWLHGMLLKNLGEILRVAVLLTKDQQLSSLSSRVGKFSDGGSA